MSIVRHDWWGGLVVPYKCRDVPTEEADWFHRKGVGRSGCGAKIPQDVRVGDTATEEAQVKLDELWHEKYRPMAELCGLVEEAALR